MDVLRALDEANRDKGKKSQYHGLIVNYVEIKRRFGNDNRLVAEITLETPFRDASLEDIEEYLSVRFVALWGEYRRFLDGFNIGGTSYKIERLYCPRGYTCITISVSDREIDLFRLNKRYVQDVIDAWANKNK